MKDMLIFEYLLQELIWKNLSCSLMHSKYPISKPHKSSRFPHTTIKISEALSHLLTKISFALFSQVSLLEASAQLERSGYMVPSGKLQVIRDFGKAKSRDYEGLFDLPSFRGAIFTFDHKRAVH
jgi:hypothetical protein